MQSISIPDYDYLSHLSVMNDPFIRSINDLSSQLNLDVCVPDKIKNPWESYSAYHQAVHETEQSNIKSCKKLLKLAIKYIALDRKTDFNFHRYSKQFTNKTYGLLENALTYDSKGVTIGHLNSEKILIMLSIKCNLNFH